MDRTLIEEIRANGGDVDFYDATIGYGRAWVLDDEDMDVDQRVLRHIASEVECGPLESDGYSVTGRLWEWCEANLDVLTRFGKEWNHDRAQIDGTDDGLCHAVTTVQQLATGDYCEEAYQWLADEWGLRHEPHGPRGRGARDGRRGRPHHARGAEDGRRDDGVLRRAVHGHRDRQGDGRHPRADRGADDKLFILIMHTLP
jgi:hypothetical protein